MSINFVKEQRDEGKLRIGCKACVLYRGWGQVNGSHVDNPRPLFPSASLSNERHLTVHNISPKKSVFITRKKEIRYQYNISFSSK